MPDIPGDTSTTATVADGGVVASAIDTLGDHDWYRITTLSYGQTITVTVTGGDSLNPCVAIYDSTGQIVLASNDDIAAGQNINSRVTFTAGQPGTYYIDVAASHDQTTGSYDLIFQGNSSGQYVWSYSQIATQLTNYYWGGDIRHWPVMPGGSLTVDIHTLTGDDQSLALAALKDWSDVIGVNFQQVTSGAQIVFSDSEDASANGPVAYTSMQTSNGIITIADITISKSWVATYGTGLNTYSFQTYIHEIGHALGLGHSGEYNDNGSYSADALFANDAWSTSVMSYFSPADSYYFNNKGFSSDYDVTPMIADILAMQQLYGLSATTRPGDTTYGFNSNVDNPVYNASLYPNAAYTIYDSSGNDTLDFSGSSSNQLINLNAGQFSNVNGQTGNLMIAPGTVIENAVGGSGSDTIIANAANNILNGGAGNDTLSYESATGGVTVNLGLTTAQDTRGSGTDTVSGFENLIGSAFNDNLIAGPTTVSISGGAGDDRIDAANANPAGTLTMSGGDGNDTFVLGVDRGPFVIDGGSGFNIVDGSAASGALLLTTNQIAPGGIDSLLRIQEIIGSNYSDNLTARFAGDILFGGGGDDTLTGYGNTQLYGGPGNDTYVLFGSTNQIVENPGEGIDTVNSAGDYILGPNFENLILHEYLPWDPYAGAAYTPAPPENWSATGNDLSNEITGNLGNNIITGGGGSDTLTGGGGNDIFLDTEAGHNGDTITDFSAQDCIVFTDASLGNFTFSLSGNALSFTNGSMTLTRVPSGHFVASAAAQGVQLSMVSATVHNDFNGDRLSDILLRSDDGTVTNWLTQPNGNFSSNAANFSINATSGWQVAGTGDFNGDGRADIMWRAPDGTVTDWLGKSDGTFFNNYASFTINASSNWQIAGTGDFNGDGNTDIMWRASDGTVTDWLGKTDGTFFNNYANFTINASSSWHIIGMGDFNGDSKSDILWRADDGTVTEWLGQANGTFFNNYANFTIGASPSWHIIGTGDFNGDGRDDILWRADDGTISDWLGQGDGSLTSNGANFTIHPTSDWHIVGTGDFNADGKTDILWQNDGGQFSDWFGQANGAVAATGQSTVTNLSTHWHVQDSFFPVV